MPLHKSRPEPTRSVTNPLPELTHQSSAESVASPITPSHEIPMHPLDKDHKNSDTTKRSQTLDSYPSSDPAVTTEIPLEQSPKLLPSKDLAFLKEDPYADDDIIPFDKNKAIIPSRSGSIRSIMSTSSMQSLKRGLGSIKRSLSRRRSERKLRQKEPKVVRQPTMVMGPDGITPIVRTHTYMMGPSFQAPRRVETYQVSAMAF